MLLLVASPLSKSGFKTIKFHRLAHSAYQCALYGCQDSVTAGLYNALHRTAAKQIFQNYTNKHMDCTSSIVKRVLFYVTGFFSYTTQMAWLMVNQQLHSSRSKPTKRSRVCCFPCYFL